MNKYKHKETEVEILTESELSGDWELVGEVKTTNSKSEEVEPTVESEVVSEEE